MKKSTEVVDSVHGKRIMKNGKPLVKPWPHDKPIAQIGYENWVEKVVNPDTNEFYPALDKAGNPIKGTGPKHTITQIIRFRRKNGNEFLYSLEEVNAYDAFGNVVGRKLLNQKYGQKLYSIIHEFTISGLIQPRWKQAGLWAQKTFTKCPSTKRI